MRVPQGRPADFSSAVFSTAVFWENLASGSSKDVAHKTRRTTGVCCQTGRARASLSIHAGGAQVDAPGRGPRRVRAWRRRPRPGWELLRRGVQSPSAGRDSCTEVRTGQRSEGLRITGACPFDFRLRCTQLLTRRRVPRQAPSPTKWPARMST